LRNGLQSPHELLNKYIEGHTTDTSYLPGTGEEEFTLYEPALKITVGIRSFEWERLATGRFVL
jgi:hypothetical protein